jgi:hypothetical protein
MSGEGESNWSLRIFSSLIGRSIEVGKETEMWGEVGIYFLFQVRMYWGENERENSDGRERGRYD